MANVQAFCNSAKLNLLKGNIALGVCDVARTIATKDAFKAALYEAGATIDANTTSYTATGEVSGTNYTAGGIDVPNVDNDPALDTGVAFWTPKTEMVYSNVTLSTAFNAMLIYSNSYALKYALSVHLFGNQTVLAGDFVLTMPSNNGTSGLIRLA
ncbi:MAG: hypothetical protein V3S69_01605 [Dehalococcoidales bacterium]